MGDNLTRYYAVHSALRQLCPHEPKGNHARHLRTLAHLVSGIVGSRRCNLGAIASKSPDANQRESRIKRYTRWLQNEHITADTYFLPYVQAFLAGLPPGCLVLVMDASAAGRNCQALVVSLVYKKRALPLAWTVARRSRGHFPEEAHVQLLKQVARLVAENTPDRPVLFMGDAEFDNVALLTAVRALGWQFVCRTGPNIIVSEEGEEFALGELHVQPGECLEVPDVFFTRQQFGPVLVVAVWEPAYKEPLYLLSNMDLPEEALHWYRLRFRIETLFSDHKSRGFYLAHSHLSDPMRLQRLMIATCLAYIWLVCLGAAVRRRGWLSKIHRKSRCDLSLFQIGLLWVEYCLNEGWAVPVFFELIPDPMIFKSVR